ncbi:unnamed protein product [Didymodactylos carnosus]|uniref:CASTOR/POLLUX/SYM8 ion channel conserved domain-containing protein n=1 Tax=Didymodactylos carnosus TaxID=1234261 RepID=A0A8S2IC25_9BILA|nr:unnamed protein product [Didymodactylos carnosus]CAF3740310.1 unnamed protein product [Didymodactylos carnosus]
MGIATFVILLFSIIYYFSNLTKTYEDALWATFTRVLDPCAAAEDEGLKHRVISGIMILIGLVIIAILIGAIVTFMDAKVDELRRGRSTVVEHNHTRWSPSIFDIIKELIIANESQRNPSIVILADKEREEMQDIIKDKVINYKNTRIICRNGDPMLINHINKLSPNKARSIIMLAPQTINPDVRVIKSILAIRNNPQRTKVNFHIVAEISERSNLDVALIAGGDEVTFVHADEIIARIMAQSGRQSGVAVILQSLLSFRYDEIYFKHERALIGRTFHDALFAYEKCSVIGLMLSDGTVKMLPPLDTVINIDDQIIVIAEDDDKIILPANYLACIAKYSSPISSYLINLSAIQLSKTTAAKVERNVICGWNNKTPLLAKELDGYVSHGSELHILTNSTEAKEFVSSHLVNELKHQKLYFHSGHMTRRCDLERLNLSTFDYVIVVPSEDGREKDLTEEADAECLICLLYIQDIIDKSNGQKTFNTVTEMYNIRNRDLADMAHADDYIIAPSLVSKYITQLSENKNIKKVYDALFTSEGPEILLCLASIFVPLHTPVSYYEVIQSTIKFRCVAIGYRLMKYVRDQTKLYGIVINPNKQEQIVFTDNDKIIVFANETVVSSSPQRQISNNRF